MVRNGDIHTIDTLGSRVQAVAIKDGKFIKVGSNDDMKAVTGKGTEVINLHGKMVMPCVADSATCFSASSRLKALLSRSRRR